MKAKLDYKSGYKAIVSLTAEDDDEKHALKLIWEEGCRLVSYAGGEKLALTNGPEQEK